MKEYRVSGSLRKNQSQFAYFLIIAGILIIVVPFALLLINGPKTDPLLTSMNTSLVITGLFQILAAMLYLWQVQVIRIVLSPNGVTYTAPGFYLQTSWDNIERIKAWGRYDYLALKNPGCRKYAWYLRFMDQKTDRKIPLSMFPSWRSTEMGEEFKKYAPRLLEVSLAQ